VNTGDLVVKGDVGEESECWGPSWLQEVRSHEGITVVIILDTAGESVGHFWLIVSI
jgi:hypothetical protein